MLPASSSCYRCALRFEHIVTQLALLPFADVVCRWQQAPVIICAEGSAVGKAVTVAEITKRRMRGLHQNTQIGVTPQDNLRHSRPVYDNVTPTIAITLSVAPLDASQPGYQPPLSESELLAAWLDDGTAAVDTESAAGVGGLKQPSGRRRRTRKRPRVQLEAMEQTAEDVLPGTEDAGEDEVCAAPESIE